MMRLLVVFALLFLPLSPAQSLSGFRDFLEQQRVAWRIPGLAVAVVQEDRVVHLSTHGTTDGEKKSPITPETLFGIGSVTKSMTVAVLQTLAEEGKLDWDRPVRDYAPDFRLSDPAVTGQVTVRDLVTHRTGLPRHDALWFRSGATREQLFAKLRFLDFSAGLRQKYQYNNLMYMAAGVVAERITGQTWEQLIRARVFQPLGLRRANTSVKEPGEYAVERRIELDAVGPAGSVNATIGEFARYLRMHMNAGTVDGARVLPEKRAREMWALQMPIGETIYEEFSEPGYGMGFFLGRFGGRKVVYHTGTISGYHTLLAFLPEERIGLVMLMNRVERAFPKLVSAHLFTQLLGLPQQDWPARYRQLEEKRAADQTPEPPLPGTQPSRAFAGFAGKYVHPAYGAVTVADDQSVEWAGHRGALEHDRYDIFRTVTAQGSALNNLRLQFLYGFSGEIEELRMPLEPSLPPIVFRKEKP